MSECVSRGQVFEVGAAISLQESQLHVVVLCHGEQPDERVLQSEGLESSYALNYLSNVVLIEQLKPLLARSVLHGSHTLRPCVGTAMNCGIKLGAQHESLLSPAAAAPMPLYSDGEVANRNVRLGAARQKMALE